ncbi:UNVERIFIED_CONTAM: hypothetical protein HDU68_002976 [Siphonaria sp. JEL0065]|nr:hypothetical protein HDU68_002976 [Siphonaria sp. JEL0065]
MTDSNESNEARIVCSYYANQPVIELIYRGVSVLRRTGYLAINGTQILTLSGITDRARRARVLDVKCVGQGWPHERIQGGAGRFQGTWMPTAQALQLAKEYGVAGIIQQLVDFVAPASNPAPGTKQNTMIAVNPADNPGSGSCTPLLTSRRAPKRKNADDDIAFKPQVGLPSTTGLKEKKRRGRPPIIKEPVNAPSDDDERDAERDEEREHRDLNSTPFIKPEFSVEERSQAFLLDIFSSSSSFTKRVFPKDLLLNSKLDAKGNSSFHWAVSLGHVQTLKDLIAFNTNNPSPNAFSSSDPFLNHAGESPLMRAMHLPNNFIRKSFLSIVKHFLGSSKDPLYVKDSHNQTLFHHAISSVIASRISIDACVYYLKTIKDVLGSPEPALLDGKDWNGDTAIGLVRRGVEGSGPIVELLLELGASEANTFAAPATTTISSSSTSGDMDVDIDDFEFGYEPSAEPSPEMPKAVIPPIPKMEPTLVTALNPEFVSKTVNTQTACFDMIAQISASCAGVLKAKTLAIEEAQTHLDSLQIQVAAVRKQNKELRTQNVKMSELAHRIGIIQKGVELEAKGLCVVQQEAIKKEEDDLSFLDDVLSESSSNPILTNTLLTSDISLLEKDIEMLQKEFDEGEEKGKKLGQEKTLLRVNGAGEFSESAANMRKIIAFSCQVPMDQIDAYLEPLLLALQNGV